MRGLKSLVIGMGVLIVVGLTVVIVTVVKRYGGDDSQSTKSPALVSVPVAHGFGEKRVQMPAGAKILETSFDGNRMVLRLGLSDGEQALLLVDINTGQRIGLIRLGTAR